MKFTTGMSIRSEIHPLCPVRFQSWKNGRTTITGLCTLVTSGPVWQLRYAAEVSPRMFQTGGGVCFQPDKTRYENTRCKPLPCEWLRARNPLDRLSQTCRERGLGLRAVVECVNIGRIAARDPHFARKNVFGDVSPSQICLVNADVAGFIRALTTDVCKNYAIGTVELTGLDAMTPRTDDPHHDPGLGARQLLALCFCESCRQSAASAGVDVEAAARSTAVRLNTVFQTGQRLSPPLAALAGDDPPLTAFLSWYRDRIAELLDSIRSSCGCRVVSHTRPLGGEEEVATDVGYTRKADAVVCDYIGRETAPLRPLLKRIGGMLADQQRLEVQLLVGSPIGGDDQALVRNLTTVAELGIASANLDHYGRLPPAGIDLVRQAVRFARRSSR